MQRGQEILALEDLRRFQRNLDIIYVLDRA
jgi:hypothetical protein